MNAPPVMVHVVFEEGGLGDVIANDLVRTLTANPSAPLSRGLGIPVRLPPPARPPRLDGARNVIVTLVDDDFIASERVGELEHHAQQSSDCCTLLPVALSEHAMKTRFAKAGPSWVRSYDDLAKGLDASQRILVAVANEAGKLLSDVDAPVRVFVSHAKADLASSVGASVLSEVHSALDDTQMAEFFDARDIPFGDDFGTVIINAIRGSAAVLVLLTDAYPTREWCRIEALEATRHRVPVVVIDALEKGGHRALPYLGSSSVMHWRAEDPGGSARDAMLSVALEVLRQRNFIKLAERFGSDAIAPQLSRVLPYPPELLTLLPVLHDGESTVMYPDPPLGTYECTVLREAAPGVLPRTPTQVAASGTSGGSLRDRVVAISVSEPSRAELREHELLPLHVTRAFVELARHLLAAGAAVAYGGNLEAHADQGRNFLELLIDLVAAYDLPDRPSRERVRNYQISHEIATAVKSGINAVATLIPVGGTEHGTAAAMSQLRERMTHDSDARIVLGGRLEGFEGLLPGIVEEAHLALKSGKPLFVMGGFGGAAAAVADLLRGQGRDELLLAYQLRETPAVLTAASESAVDHAELERRYERVVGDFIAAGVEGLNNHLDPEENALLMTSDDPETCIALVLAGLQRLKQE